MRSGTFRFPQPDRPNRFVKERPGSRISPQFRREISMRGHLPRRLLTLVLLAPAFALGSVQESPSAPPTSPSGRGALPPSRITRTSRPMRLLRSWEEPVKSEAGDHSRRVDVIVDYSTGEAWERFTSVSGEPLGRMSIAIASPRPSPEEIAEAFQFARRSSEL